MRGWITAGQFQSGTLGETWIQPFEEIMQQYVTRAREGQTVPEECEEAALSVGRGR